MSHKVGVFSHGAHRTSEPQLDCHPSASSEGMSDTQKKIWAIFFGFLLLPNDPLSSNAPRPIIHGQGPMNDPSDSTGEVARQVALLSPNTSATTPYALTLPSELVRTIKPAEPEEGESYWGVINRLVNGLGSLLSGPLGRLLAFSNPVSAKEEQQKVQPSPPFVLPAPYAHGFVVPVPNSDKKEFLSVPQCMADGIVEAAKSFNTYVRENPDSAETMLKAGSLVAAAGVGIVCAPEEAVVGAAVGATWGFYALRAALIDLTADWGGKKLYELFPNQINFVVNTAMDPLKKAFPSLSEREVEISAGAAAVITLSFLHLRYIREVVPKGVFVAGVKEMGLHSFKDASFEQIIGPTGTRGTFEFSSDDAKNFFSDFFPSSSVEPGTPLVDPPEAEGAFEFSSEDAKKFFSDLFPSSSVEPGTPFYELLHKTQQKSYEPFVQSAKEAAQAREKEMHLRQQYEKKTDWINEFQKQEALNKIREAQAKYTQTKGRFSDHTYFASAIASIMGNDKAAQFFVNGGQAMLMIMDGVRGISKVGSAFSAAASGAAAGAPAGAPGMIVLGIANFIVAAISLSRDDGNEAMQAMYNGLMQGFRALFLDNAMLREEMWNGFAQVRNQISDFQYYAMLRFLMIDQRIEDLQISNSYFSKQILDHIGFVYNHLQPKTQATLLQPMIASCSAIDLYSPRHQNRPLGTMKEEKIRKHCAVLEDAILGVTVPHYSVNGVSCNTFTPEIINKNLKSLFPGDLLGYLAPIAEVYSGKPLPEKVTPAALPNMRLYHDEARHYLTLRQAAIPPSMHYDDQEVLLAAVVNEGDRLQRFIEYIQNNKPLLENLLTKLYKPNLDALQGVFTQAFEREAQKVSLEVSKKAEIHNRQELEKFPVFRKLADYRGTTSDMMIDNFQRSLDKKLEDFNKRTKELLEHSLNETFLSRQNFKTSLDKSKKDILEALSKRTPLSAFVVPNSTKESQVPLLPLSVTKVWDKIEKYIPHDASIGEENDLGMLQFQYSAPTVKEISMQIAFKKTDGTIIDLGSVNLSEEGIPTLGMVGSYDLGASVAAARSMYWVSRYFDDAWRGFKSHIESHELLAVHLSFMWKTAEVKSWTPVPGANETLAAYVNGEIVKKRKEILSKSFYGETALANWKKGLEALDSPVNLLKAFGTIAGFNATEMLEVSKLLSEEAIEKYLKEYLLGNVTAETPLLPPQTEEEFARISSTILSRFDHTHGPAENPFSAPLIDLLAGFAKFSFKHQKALRERGKEKAPEAPEEGCSQEVGGLKEKIGELESKIDQMAEAMKKMSLKEKK